MRLPNNHFLMRRRPLFFWLSVPRSSPPSLAPFAYPPSSHPPFSTRPCCCSVSTCSRGIGAQTILISPLRLLKVWTFFATVILSNLPSTVLCPSFVFGVPILLYSLSPHCHASACPLPSLPTLSLTLSLSLVCLNFLLCIQTWSVFITLFVWQELG